MFEYTECLCNIKALLVLIGIYLLYKFYTTHYNLHLKLGRKGPPPLPFLGNILAISRHGFHDTDKRNLRKYGKLYPFYLGNMKLCMVSDEELMKQIFIKQTKSFTDRMDFGMNGELVEKMLTELKGKDWERVRYLVSPTFTSVKLKKMFPMITGGIELLGKVLEQHPTGKPINLKEIFNALTIDVIARTMFGMQIESQTDPNNKFLYHAEKLFNTPVFHPLFGFFLLFPGLGPLIHKLFPKWEIFGPETLDFFESNLQRTIKEREKSTEQYNDFLTMMLNAHKEVDQSGSDQPEISGSKYLTNREIIAQCLIFLFAGFETTSTTLTYVSYFLAQNRTAQQEVYDEIVDTIETGGELTYDSLTTMPRLDAAICETLRLCPPVVRIDRTCTQDTVLVTSDKRTITAKKGDIFTVPIYAIHTDPSIWSDPDIYDLHRFDPENKKHHSQFSFLPFGLGPRNCVGMRFALLEAKLALANILQKFEIMPCAETTKKIRFITNGFSTPSVPIILKLVKRE